MDTFIKDIRISKLSEFKYIKPFEISFTQKGLKRKWECVKVHDSVSSLLYHKEFDSFLLVKQFRPPVWFYQKENGLKSSQLGFTYELCAGIMDKNLSQEDTIKEEIIEETGYEVSQLRLITTCYNGLGFGANRQDIFYATIDESMKKSRGGGVDGEDIELFFLKRERAKDFIFDNSIIRAPSLLFAMLWFFENEKNLI